jgi:RNA polymerase sigma factor, sigma-70 family
LEELIKKIQAGDEMAFKKLVQNIENDLYRLAKTRLNDNDDIKDAIQNTMLITYKNARKIKNYDAFKTWMFRVLINECNKIYNKNKKSNVILDKIINNTDFTYYEDPIENIHDKMNFDILISKLKYEERIVLTLYYNSCLSYSQISKILKTNENTVKSRITRAIQKLKKLYKEAEVYGEKK